MEEQQTRGMTPDFYIAQIQQQVQQHMTRFKRVDLINIGRHIEDLCEDYACEFFANFTELEEFGYQGLEDIDAFKAIYLDIEKLEQKLELLFNLSDLGADSRIQLSYEEICWGFVQAEIEKAKMALDKKNIIPAFEYILQAQKGIMLADKLSTCDLMENEFEFQRKLRKKSRNSLSGIRNRAESSKKDKEKLFELYDEESLKNPGISRAKKIENIYIAYLSEIGKLPEEKGDGELPEEKDYYDTMNKWISKRENEQENKKKRQDLLEKKID